MSLNYLKDPASQVATLPASGDGVDAVLRYYENGTEEVKNLLKNECSMIYECSYCRSLFRSIINFVAHKRTICRSLQSSLRAEQLETFRDQQSSSIGATEEGKKKNLRALRRFNPVSSLSKHIRPVKVRLEKANADIEVQTLARTIRPTAKTTIVDGRQVVEELPPEISIKEHLPANRVALVVPRETSIRYGEMQLRRRRSAHLTKRLDESNVLRELTPEEIAIVERIPSAIPVDFITLRCEDERCVRDGQQPFNDLAALAHHLAIQHQVDYSEEGLLKKPVPHIKCFLCDISPLGSLKELQKHFYDSHYEVLGQHTQVRINRLACDPAKRKEINNYRPRSLSPFSNRSNEEEDVQRQIESKEMQMRKMKARRFGREPKPVQIPQMKLTVEEQKKQQLNAAFALKQWIEARQRQQQAEEKSDDGDSGKTDGGDGYDSEEQLDPDFSDFLVLDKAAGPSISQMTSARTRMYKNDSPQIKPIIDEEEARKIDQMLNSRTPIHQEPAETSGDQLTVALDESLPMVRSRSPRPRRPNKKYENYYGTIESEQSKKFGESSKSTTPGKTSADSAKSVKNTLIKREISLKRGLSGAGIEQTKRKYKRRKIIGARTQRRKNPEGANANPVAATEAATASSSAGVEAAIKDFVLPDSIKDTDVNGSNGEQREKSKDADNNAEKDGAKDSNSTCPTQSAPAASDTLKQDAVGSPALTQEKLPSMLADRNREDLTMLYTPRARRMREADRLRRGFNSSEPSRRKQNLNELSAEDADGYSVVGTSSGKQAKASSMYRQEPPPKPKDLAQIPVYLTEAQRDLFFKPLKTLFNQNINSDGLCQCGECGEVLKSIKDGRRHMVSHIRVIRVRCSLCDVGAFFCSDMRIHLMYRHCDKLNLAPDDFVAPGSIVPCMDKEKADMLTQLIDPHNPGRILYSTGKIVSWTNPRAYFPDPKIERNILGPMLPGYMPSPNTSPRKLVRSAILTPKKNVHSEQQSEKEEKTQSEDTQNTADDRQLATTSPRNQEIPSNEGQMDTQPAADADMEQPEAAAVGEKFSAGIDSSWAVAAGDHDYQMAPGSHGGDGGKGGT